MGVEVPGLPPAVLSGGDLLPHSEHHHGCRDLCVFAAGPPTTISRKKLKKRGRGQTRSHCCPWSPPSLLVLCLVSSTQQSMSSVSGTPVYFPSSLNSGGALSQAQRHLAALGSPCSPPFPFHPADIRKARLGWLWGGAWQGVPLPNSNRVGPGHWVLSKALPCQAALSRKPDWALVGGVSASQQSTVGKWLMTRHLVPKHVAASTVNFCWPSNR